MNVYKYTEDIVSRDAWGDPELNDRLNIYLFYDITVYHSERYDDWTLLNHYNISNNKNTIEIKPTKLEMQGFITALFKQDDK